MKLQINGFDIEINTEESNLTMTVIDANGKELSNQTYAQTEATQTTEVTPVDMPSAEDTANATADADATPATTDAPATPDATAEAPAAEGEVIENVIPDYETFRKLRLEGKI